MSLQSIRQKMIEMDKKIDAIYAVITKPEEVPFDCQDIKEKNKEPDLESGIFVIEVPGYPRKKVYCNFTNNESWTTISRRVHEMNIFNRTWDEYAKGFGKGKADYWLGNDIIHELTSTHKYKLRISMEGFSIRGGKAYSVYDSFRIGSKNLSYPLTLGKYLSDQSNGGDSFHPTARCNETSNHDKTFSTPDYGVSSSCARKLTGGWWFTNCGCSNLNGEIILGGTLSSTDHRRGMYWDTLYYNLWDMKSPLRKVVMEISRV
ncbi:ficolin-1-A-like [Argonauta hians]